MKKFNTVAAALVLLLVIFVLPGCSAITGIFKAGVWTGLIIVAFVVLLIIFLLGRGKK